MHHLGQKAEVRHISNQGKNWFVVVYGAYANTALAQNATKELPRKLQQTSPWVRSIKNLNEHEVG
jgi:septal ring-binding cell division protein DamX